MVMPRRQRDMGVVEPFGAIHKEHNNALDHKVSLLNSLGQSKQSLPVGSQHIHLLRLLVSAQSKYYECTT